MSGGGGGGRGSRAGVRAERKTGAKPRQALSTIVGPLRFIGSAMESQYRKGVIGSKLRVRVITLAAVERMVCRGT